MLYINDLSDDVTCNIPIYVDDTTVHCKCDHALDLWQQLQFASEHESDHLDTLDWGRKLLLISAMEKLDLFCLNGLITLVLLM